MRVQLTPVGIVILDELFNAKPCFFPKSAGGLN
jgi:hypothetical protein